MTYVKGKYSLRPGHAQDKAKEGARALGARGEKILRSSSELEQGTKNRETT